MEEALQEAVEDFTIFGLDPTIFGIKLLFFVFVVVVASLVQRVVVRLIRRFVTSYSHLPSASIVVNFARCIVWVLAFLIVLEPVFGVDPAGFVAALGVASIVISLGLKDTISNIFGGFMLMVGRVVQPGDYVTIAGVTGTVVDITMRHTVVENRLEERIVIPNSILNTTSIQRLPASSESFATFEFTMGSGFDPNVVAADMVATMKVAVGDRLSEGTEPRVVFDSITPYGVKGQVFFNLKPGIPFAGVRNDMVRSIACKEYFSVAGARALGGGQLQARGVIE